jgi:hypothetical protein
MGFGQTGMFEFDEKVLNVAGQTDATPAGCVVPFDVNTRKFVTGHIELDPVELLENIAEMVEVFEPNILHPKAINDETELDGTSFVAPEAWCGFGFVISFSKKAGLEEIVGTNAGLGKAIPALANFELDPIITIATLKFVLMNSARMSAILMWTYSESGIGALSMELKRAPGQESMLLRSSLTSSRDAVLVPM